MKVDHIFGGHIYLISSYGVARNPIFKDNIDIAFFASNIEKYLGEICDIYAYSHQNNQFQYLVKIKERLLLEQFFFNKKVSKGKKNIAHNLYDTKADTPPDSYLIFSQEVSNCLNSYAKKFNFRHKRKGGLFADRYSKILVETEEEMEEWIDKLNRMEKLVFFEEEWKTLDSSNFSNNSGECSSLINYNEEGEHKNQVTFNNFTHWFRQNLRGCFDCLPPKSKKSQNYLEKYLIYKKIKGIDPPW